MNPRAATNGLLPFQGSPFSHLGTSAMSRFPLYKQRLNPANGEGGIRTHAPLRTNGFQDRLVMTTSIPLQTCFYILIEVHAFVKHYFLFHKYRGALLLLCLALNHSPEATWIFYHCLFHLSTDFYKFFFYFSTRCKYSKSRCFACSTVLKFSSIPAM